MERIILYTDGNSLSTTAFDNWEVAKFVRLVADEGKAITDGIDIINRIDTNRPENWSDCDSPEEAEVTEADYITALNEMGVEV